MHLRTDGERALVATPPARTIKKESYAFSVSERGDIAFEAKPRIA